MPKRVKYVPLDEKKSSKHRKHRTPVSESESESSSSSDSERSPSPPPLKRQNGYYKERTSKRLVKDKERSDDGAVYDPSYYEFLEMKQRESEGKKKKKEPKSKKGKDDNVSGSIIDKKTEGRKVFYLVKWKGNGNSSRSWESRASLMKTVPHLVKEYDAS